MSYEAKPGDLCRFITNDKGGVVAAEHVAPCSGGFATGTMTDIRTGKPLTAWGRARITTAPAAS